MSRFFIQLSERASTETALLFVSTHSVETNREYVLFENLAIKVSPFFLNALRPLRKATGTGSTAATG